MCLSPTRDKRHGSNTGGVAPWDIRRRPSLYLSHSRSRVRRWDPLRHTTALLLLVAFFGLWQETRKQSVRWDSSNQMERPGTNSLDIAFLLLVTTTEGTTRDGHNHRRRPHRPWTITHVCRTRHPSQVTVETGHRGFSRERTGTVARRGESTPR